MSKAGKWFAQQWAKSNIISGFLALAIWGVILYLAITGAAVPPILASAGGAIIVFFFKAKEAAGG
jgi:hypothetical protein